MRRHNLASLLRLVHVRGATSRSDLAALTGLNRSTVKALTADLAQAGLVRESAPVGRGSAGRPSITVEPESELVYVLALDIGVEHLTAVRVGLGGVVLDRRELTQSPKDYDVRRTLRRLNKLTCALLADAPPKARCVGVGVGVCGVVSTDDGLVRFAPNLAWVDVPLRALLAEALRTSLRIELGNDGDLGARAEHLRGAASGLSDVVYISGEVGVGGGIILDGRPMRGYGGYGGEIGHMSIDPKGQGCRCGRRGCWETEVGDEAVLLATGAPTGMSLAQVLDAYAAGERWPRAGMRRVARSLSVGVVNLVNIFNPQLILFGGAVRLIYLAVEPLVQQALKEALSAPGEQVRLGLAGLGDDSIAIGAAELAFARLLDDPLGTLGRLPELLRAPA
ncbi:MAG: family transcriptional regulator [Frankiales bacterium]|nr:family transcriptional regulator [Frankiales bacterium]